MAEAAATAAKLPLRLAHLVFDELNDGVCLASPTGELLYANAAARRLMELKDDETSLCRALCARLDPRVGRCPLRTPGDPTRAVTFLGRHGPHAAYSWLGEQISKGQRWNDLRVRCLRVHQPGADGLHLALIEDASAERELERQRDDWRSMIAHDLRQPLSNIFAALKLIEETRAPHGAQDKLVPLALRSCARMMELLDLYLEVARLDSGASAVRLERVSVAQVVERAVAERALAAAARRIATELDVPPDLAVSAEPELLRRVVENLVDNAVKYNVDGGKVRVSARAREGAAEIRVSDTGRGIDPRDLPFIFDRFYQAEARRAGRLEGAGLGLTFCREALKRMGGEISAESDAGRGSTFTVLLRLSEAPS